MNDAQMEMPKYKSHKEVWALKIAEVKRDSDNASKEGRETDGSAILVFEDSRYAPIKVLHEYVRKHNPQPGGYYVRYKDGYESWSPADAFESGYTKIKQKKTMEAKIYKLDEMRPHVVIPGLCAVHVLPLELLIKMANGKISIGQVEGFNDFVPQVIWEWLGF